MKNVMWGIAFALILVAGGGFARAAGAPDVTPFTTVGFIQSLSLDDPGDVLSGARIQVNGVSIVIPRNTILTLPAAFMTPQELFASAPPPYGPTQSGLALQDVPMPGVTYEATIEGNRVGDSYIAGRVNISQQAANAAQGPISYIDYSKGELRVGGALGDPDGGARVQLNDPDGRFGRVMSPDVRFTVDSENPTVHAATGYPMCIPRTNPAIADDPLCPQANRPTDPVTHAFRTRFTMQAPVGLVTTDPTRQAPLEVGDYITYSGTLFHDADGDYVSAHTVDDAVAIFTTPGTQPSYMSIETILMGVAATPVPNVPQEVTTRFNIVGFTSDPFTLVDIYAIDVNPCSGRESERYLTTANPLAQGTLGRFLFVTDASSFSPPVREIRVRARSGSMSNVANGLTSGQYRSPIPSFVFPENAILGDPRLPLNFEDFPFLARGTGPYKGGPTVSTLSPWPGANPPPTIVCVGDNGMPVANAGEDFTVGGLTTAQLDGHRSFDPDNGLLSFHWTQTSGPPVTLSNANAPMPTFLAPRSRSASNVVLTFNLEVSDGSFSATDSVTVTVLPAATDTVTITSATFSLVRSTLIVRARSSDASGVPILTVVGFGQMSFDGVGSYTFIMRGAHQASSVTVRSSRGGAASSPVAFVR